MSWTFPENVRGWLSLQEGRKLADLARGKRVLEIGSFEGRSTICMAQTAKTVDCIDPFDGRGTEWAGDTSVEEFRDNLDSYGVGNVTIYEGITEHVVAHKTLDPFDLIFIDGAHDGQSVRSDIDHALKLLAPNGLLVFHDYQRRGDPDVTLAVNRLLVNGGELRERCETLAVVQPCKVDPVKPIVCLGMPMRGGVAHFGASQGYHLWPTVGACTVVRAHTASSLLDHTFNRLWCCALNLRDQGVTHFAMIHDDITPMQGWLDVLYRELVRTKADILSTVIPIKGPDGLTSTAIESSDIWQPRRLTMTEVHSLPDTFGDEEAEGDLLLNSGLWICDLRGAWVDEPYPLCFQTLNRIINDDKGEWQAQVRSEDWEFSRAARARGAVLKATRLVTATHCGDADYPNDHAWGTAKVDPVHVAKLAKQPQLQEAVA